MQLFPSDIAILTDLSEARGLTVSEMVVREQSHVGFALDRRQRAGQLAYRLKQLEGQGYVARMDEQKPIAWVITPKGTEAVEAAAKRREVTI